MHAFIPKIFPAMNFKINHPIKPNKAVSSALVDLASDVYKVNKNGAKTVPCGALCLK